ncbi:MAG: 6-phosphofructokinase [Lachnospiraceae bacterium]|nr:6-phosphofructokinase [Lachnospiraceae bacterium]
MLALKGAAIFGQSGGPSSVINSSALGCIETALKNENITKVYAMEHGIVGMLNDRIYDMTQEDAAELRLMLHTPSSIFGSCRYKLKDDDVEPDDYRRILEIFKKYDIRYFFYNGGNDSMDTCNKISKYMQKVGYECRVMGIPKTIDNDLAGTDHCPGYGSAAKYIAVSMGEIYHDANVYNSGMVIVVEIMGRNAGWLTAAASLADINSHGPDLIYLPEVPFDMQSFLDEVELIYERKHNCIVAVSEGIMDKDGKYISEYGSDMAATKDAFGHAQMGGLAATLARYIKNRTGAKTRAIELSLLQRCAAHCASQTDIDEAYMAGRRAVEAAVEGITDKMVGFECSRIDGNYKCDTKLFDLKVVANAEKKVPREWINEEGNGILAPFVDYALPLIQGFPEIPEEKGMPRYAKLKKIYAK